MSVRIPPDGCTRLKKEKKREKNPKNKQPTQNTRASEVGRRIPSAVHLQTEGELPRPCRRENTRRPVTLTALAAPSSRLTAGTADDSRHPESSASGYKQTSVAEESGGVGARSDKKTRISLYLIASAAWKRAHSIRLWPHKAGNYRFTRNCWGRQWRVRPLASWLQWLIH